MALQVLCS